ncbi:MAG: hypothetical protein ABH857_01265 [Elusimicrobiota bacterium]
MIKNKGISLLLFFSFFCFFCIISFSIAENTREFRQQRFAVKAKEPQTKEEIENVKQFEKKQTEYKKIKTAYLDLLEKETEVLRDLKSYIDELTIDNYRRGMEYVKFFPDVEKPLKFQNQIIEAMGQGDYESCIKLLDKIKLSLKEAEGLRIKAEKAKDRLSAQERILDNFCEVNALDVNEYIKQGFISEPKIETVGEIKLKNKYDSNALIYSINTQAVESAEKMLQKILEYELRVKQGIKEDRQILKTMLNDIDYKKTVDMTDKEFELYKNELDNNIGLLGIARFESMKEELNHLIPSLKLWLSRDSAVIVYSKSVIEQDNALKFLYSDFWVSGRGKEILKERKNRKENAPVILNIEILNHEKKILRNKISDKDLNDKKNIFLRGRVVSGYAVSEVAITVNNQNYKARLDNEKAVSNTHKEKSWEIEYKLDVYGDYDFKITALADPMRAEADYKISYSNLLNIKSKIENLYARLIDSYSTDDVGGILLSYDKNWSASNGKKYINLEDNLYQMFADFQNAALSITGMQINPDSSGEYAAIVSYSFKLKAESVDSPGKLKTMQGNITDYIIKKGKYLLIAKTNGREIALSN